MTRQRPEQIIHKAIVGHLKARLPKPWLYWHTPNGGYRGRIEAAIFKALGTRPGIPDLFVAGEGRVIGLEVKAPKGSLSPAQRDTIAALNAAGIPVLVVRSIDEAVEALTSMGVPINGRVL